MCVCVCVLTCVCVEPPEVVSYSLLREALLLASSPPLHSAPSLHLSNHVFGTCLSAHQCREQKIIQGDAFWLDPFWLFNVFFSLRFSSGREVMFPAVFGVSGLSGSTEIKISHYMIFSLSVVCVCVYVCVCWIHARSSVL